MKTSLDTQLTQALAFNDLYGALLVQDMFGIDPAIDDPLFVIAMPAGSPRSARVAPALLILAALAMVAYVAVPRNRSR